MRSLQVALFVLGAASFLAAAFFIGQGMGDTLWRLGVAAMLTELACIRLWPSAKRG